MTTGWEQCFFCAVFYAKLLSMTDVDLSDLPEAQHSLPAVLDELNPSAPLVKRLKKAGPEVVVMLDTLLSEARLPAEAVEWVEEDETAKEILGVVKKVNNESSAQNYQFAIQKITRLIETSG